MTSVGGAANPSPLDSLSLGERGDDSRGEGAGSRSTIDGAFYAIGGECTHMGGPLGDGQLEGTVVTCPWHSAEFDVTTSEVKCPPAEEPEPAYQVRVVGDDVQVALE